MVLKNIVLTVILSIIGLSVLNLTGCATASLKTPIYSSDEVKQEEIYQLKLANKRQL